jgi:hypothetical protein
MTGLTWAERDHEFGVDQGVFFSPDGTAEAWTGIVSVEENTPELRTRTVYIDGVKTVNQRSEDSFSGTIVAYSYPPALENKRLVFGLSYRVQTADGYKIHLVYNARAHFSGHTYAMEQYDPFSIDITTTPIAIFESKASAHLVIDSSLATPAAMANLEALLYGSDAGAARLPTPDEVVAIFDADPLIKVIDNGDGTFTVDGPDELVHMLDATEFEVISPVAVYLDGESYTIRSF